MAFEDFQFLDMEPDFSVKPEYSDTTGQATVAIAHARSVVLFPQPAASRISLQYVFLTKAEQREFLAFWSGQSGRQEAFWLPSWQRDLHVTDGLENGSSVLTITETEFDSGWNPAAEGDPGYYLFIYSRVNGLITRRVVSVVDTAVTLANPLLWTDENAIVGFVFLARFDQDELILKAVAPGKSLTQVQFRQARNPNL